MRKKKYEKYKYPVRSDYDKDGKRTLGVRYVIVSKDGSLGFYKNDSSRHIRRTVLTFKLRVQAEKFLHIVRNRFGIDCEIEEREIDFSVIERDKVS